jgi:putative ubiquitin-RnfH superfamily antitoxin RatB of RatAB toxin-antitoxin module
VQVCVVYSPAPRQFFEWLVELPASAQLSQAIAASGLALEFPGLEVSTLEFGIWGQRAPVGQLLREGDRIEIYRALRVDPKVARRERFRRQGAKSAGLFAQKRAGAKAGY